MEQVITKRISWRLALSFLWVLVALATPSCGRSPRCHEAEHTANWRQENGRLKVLVTVSVIEDLVTRVGGEEIDVLTLISGQLDPHSYQLVKGDAEKLARADVIFCNGLGLEHNPSLRYLLTHTPKAVFLGDAVRQRHPELILESEGQADPHLWMDMSLWAECLDDVVSSLSHFLPEKASVFQMRGEAMRRAMLEQHAQIRQRLQALPEERRYLVASHDAFNYFARAYLATPEEQAQNKGCRRFLSPEGLAPESQLSTAHLQTVLSYLENHRIHVVFPEATLSPDALKKLVDAAQKKGLKVRLASRPLLADSLACPGSAGDSYLGMIEYDADVIYNELSQES